VKTVHVEVSDQVYAMLCRLVRTGLYGQNEAEAAERIICQNLEDNSSAYDHDHQRERCPASTDGMHFPGCGCE
jgi:hypothetical protein